MDRAGHRSHHDPAGPRLRIVALEISSRADFDFIHELPHFIVVEKFLFERSYIELAPQYRHGHDILPAAHRRSVGRRDRWPIHHRRVLRREGKLDLAGRFRSQRMLSNDLQESFDSGVQLARARIRLECDLRKMKTSEASKI